MKMELTEEESKIAQEAKRYIIKNKKALISKFASPDIYFPSPEFTPVAVFTAGWPGVGKTEYASKYIPALEKLLDLRGVPIKIVHIDTDACREFIKGYDGSIPHVFQGAASRAVHELFNYVHKKELNYLLDTTFASSVTLTSLERAINKGWLVVVEFVYLNPKLAWINTLARRDREGRVVPEEVFVDAYFNSIENANRVKEKYGDNVILDVAIKGTKQNSTYFGLKRYEINVKTIEPHLPKPYTEDELLKVIKDANVEYDEEIKKK